MEPQSPQARHVGHVRALLALIAGFSAAVLHMISLGMVTAFGQDRNSADPVEGQRRLDLSSGTIELALLRPTTARQILQLLADGRAH